MTTELVQQGLAKARVGDLEDARKLLRRATYEMPDNVEAWLGLAGVVESLESKQECFSKVLELEPTNDQAQAGLALVEQKLAEQQARRQSNTGLSYCYRHPEIETGLRCNRCNKPICPKCAQRTPVGFRCPDCIREQEDKFYSGVGSDYIIAVVVAFPLSLIIAGLFTTIFGRFGFFGLIFAFFVAPAVTGFIAEAVRWAVKKRRSRYLRYVVNGCFIVATVPFVILGFLGGGLWGIVAPGLLLFLGVTTISVRLR